MKYDKYTNILLRYKYGYFVRCESVQVIIIDSDGGNAVILI